MSDVSVKMMSIPATGKEEARLALPPGFRFHPTDEEVVTHYLTHKALDSSFACVVIADVDLNKCEPWDLPGMAKMGEKEWFFFCHKDRKYPTGTRTNRATASGYWKATGKDKEIFRGRGLLVGMKKTLVFYRGRAPRGDKTPWVMHEYRLEGKLPPHLPRGAKEDWAVCRVFNKDLLMAKQPAPPAAAVDSPLAFLDATDLPPLMDSPFADLSTSSTSAGAHQQEQAGAGLVKTEPSSQLLLQDPTSYFSLPAPTTSSSADQPLPIRRQHGKPKAGGDMAASHLVVSELDDLTDYSNMWSSIMD